MNVLGIDTATGCLGLIAKKGDETAVFQASSGLRHGENLLPWIQRLLETVGLKPTELSLIVCSLGPGSFTGLRIGLAAAKGLSLSAGCPLSGVGSLDVFGARYGFFAGTVVPVIDARKRRFYAALYEGGRRTGDYLDAAPEELRELLGRREKILLTGPDADKIYPEDSSVPRPEHAVVLLSAQELPTLLELGLRAWEIHGPLSDGAGPIYVRPSEAELGQK